MKEKKKSVYIDRKPEISGYVGRGTGTYLSEPKLKKLDRWNGREDI